MEHIIYDYSQGACRGCEVPKTEVTGPEHWRELNERCDQCGARVEREKLVELLWEYDQMRMMRMSIEECVDRLIPKGVTVQQWISVKDRLPELIPCSAGTAYSEAVNVLTSGRKVLTAIWDGTDFIADADFWDAEGEEITHWTPVILPLPQPEKGEPNDKC